MLRNRRRFHARALTPLVLAAWVLSFAGAAAGQTESPEPTASPTETFTQQAVPTATESPTAASSSTSTPTATDTISPSPRPSPSPTPTATETLPPGTPTSTPTTTPTLTGSPQPRIEFLSCDAPASTGRIQVLVDGITPPDKDVFAASFEQDGYEVSPDLDADGKSDIVALQETGLAALLTDAEAFAMGVCTAFTVREFQFPADAIDVGNFAVNTDPDRFPDLAILQSGELGTPGIVRILVNDGSGGFTSTLEKVTENSPKLLVGADFDDDESLDMAVAAFRTGEGVQVIFGKVSPTEFNPIGRPVDSLVAGDFNGDGFLDLAALTRRDCAGSATPNLAIILRDPTSFRGFLEAIDFCVPGAPDRLIAADLDRAGGDDLAVTFTDRNEVAVLLLNPSIASGVSLEERPRLETQGSATTLSAGDFDRDGFVDLAAGDESASQDPFVRLFYGGGDGFFVRPQDVALPRRAEAMTVGFFDADRKPDIVIAGEGPACVGDCDNDGCVSDVEAQVVAGLADEDLEECPNADADLDGQLTVSERVQAQNNIDRCAGESEPPCTATVDASTDGTGRVSLLTFLLSANAAATPTPTDTATRTPTGSPTDTATPGTPSPTNTATRTVTRTVTITRTRTPTAIPTQTCESSFCVQGESCAVVPAGGNGGGFAPLFIAGLLAALRAVGRRSRD